MKKLLTILALLLSTLAVAADPVQNGTVTNDVYILVNAEGKRLITNVKPFPKGYTVVETIRDGAIIKKDK